MAKNKQGETLPDFFVGYEKPEQEASKRQVRYVDVGHLPPKEALKTVERVTAEHRRRRVPPHEVLQKLIDYAAKYDDVLKDVKILRMEHGLVDIYLTLWLKTPLREGQLTMRMQDVIFEAGTETWVPIFMKKLKEAVQ